LHFSPVKPVYKLKSQKNNEATLVAVFLLQRIYRNTRTGEKQKPLYNKAEGPTSLGQTDPGIFTTISSFTL